MKRNVFWALVGSGQEGMLNQYEKMAPQLPEWEDSNWVPWFDYGPLRMLVIIGFRTSEHGEWEETADMRDDLRPMRVFLSEKILP